MSGSHGGRHGKLVLEHFVTLVVIPVLPPPEEISETEPTPRWHTTSQTGAVETRRSPTIRPPSGWSLDADIVPPLSVPASQRNLAREGTHAHTQCWPCVFAGGSSHDESRWDFVAGSDSGWKGGTLPTEPHSIQQSRSGRLEPPVVRYGGLARRIGHGPEGSSASREATASRDDLWKVRHPQGVGLSLAIEC